MSDTPIYGLRDNIAPSLDRAVMIAAPNDKALWEILFMPTPQGIVPGLLMSMPSPILGAGSFTAWRVPFDIASLANEDVALELVRSLVGTLRDSKAEALKVQMPGN